MGKPTKKKATKKTVAKPTVGITEERFASLEKKVNDLLSIFESLCKRSEDVNRIAKQAEVFVEAGSKTIQECVAMAKRNGIKINSSILAFKDQLDTLVNDQTVTSATLNQILSLQNLQGKASAEIAGDIQVIYQELDIIKSLGGMTDKVNQEVIERLKLTLEEKKKESKDGNA